MMKPRNFSNTLLLLGSFIFSLVLAESSLRLFIIPSKECYGVLFGRKLPPYPLPFKEDEKDLSGNPYPDLLVNGGALTYGDLWGIHREDPLIGYTHTENARSTNGWWSSNNLGARGSTELSLHIPPGKKRLLVFGESFAHSSRVPNEETFEFYLDQADPGLETVNFGVDGYSMAQAYLRFSTIKDRLDYDAVLMVFNPENDLFRDVNVIRSLVGWKSHKPYPRFVVENGRLKLAAMPYGTLREYGEDNRKGPSEKLKTHLRRYDRFYRKELYEMNGWLGQSIIYKLFAQRSNQQIKIMQENLKDPKSEAMQVSRKIFQSMQADVRLKGKAFAVVLLPDNVEVKNYQKNPRKKEVWDKLVSFMRAGGFPCLDLMQELQKTPWDALDEGYDGSHYGPNTNRLVASAIRRDALPAVWPDGA